MSTRRWEVKELAGDPTITSMISSDPKYQVKTGDIVEEPVLEIRLKSGEYLVSKKDEIKTRERNRKTAKNEPVTDPGENDGTSQS
jgi:hypothetical protein